LALVGFFLLIFRVFQIYIFSVATLLTKLKRSEIGLDSTQPGFEELTKSCHERNLPVDAWRSAERLAMEKRGEYLRIFDINHQKAPTLAQIMLFLIEKDDASNSTSTVVDWISDGIKAQNNQFVIFEFVIQFSKKDLLDPSY
jgi:hypothetical protein